MTDDTKQLREYAATGSDDAFAAVVQRYVSLVFAAALRRVGGDVHRAQDIVQLVFTALARNAKTLADHPDVTGWLFTTTRFLAAKVVRGEQRRQSREQAASITHAVGSDDSMSESSAPVHAVLDEVLMELRQLDRQVILLRFHRGLRLAEIGAQLGATENAVQKRVDRALDQLKDKLARRGITSTAAALAVAFEQQAAVAMPAGMAAAAMSAGLACGVGTGSLLAVSTLMTVSKLQIGIASALIAATSASLLWQVNTNAGLRAEMAERTAATSARMAALQDKVASLSHVAEAAETDANSLRSALQVARASPAPERRAGTLADPAEQAKAAMARASKLAQEGRLQEALDEYMKCYRGLAGGRAVLFQQLVSSAMRNLASKYPPAVAALRELRDQAMQNLHANPSRPELVREIAVLNERLGEGRATMGLYDSLPPGDSGRQALGLIAHNAFIEERRYGDVLAGKTFGAMLNELDMGARYSAGKSDQSLVNQRAYVVKATLTNIEALTGAGKLEDARALTQKLLAYDDSEATRAGIKHHVERASQASAP